MGWQDATEQALSTITDHRRARDLLVQAATDSTAEARKAIATEIEQLIEAIKQTRGNATYRGSYRLLGHRDRHAALRAWAPTTPTTATRPAAAGGGGSLREIGPGVTMSINTVAAATSPRRRPVGGRRRQAARHAARRGRSPARSDAAAAAGTDLAAARRQPRPAARGPRRATARRQPPRGGDRAASPRSRSRRSGSSGTPRTPTSPRRSSTSTHRQAAYQAALKAGARSCRPRSWTSSAEPVPTVPPPMETRSTWHVHRYLRARASAASRSRPARSSSSPRGLIGLGGSRYALVAQPTTTARSSGCTRWTTRPGAAGDEPVAVLRRLRGRALRRRHRARRRPTPPTPSG